MSRSPTRALVLVSLLGGLLAACAAPADGVDSDDSALSSAPPMAKNDHKSGPYAGGTVAYSFYISAGDVVTADVTVPGTASASITDASGSTVLATSAGGGSDARVSFTGPPGGYTPLQIVFSGTATGGNYNVKLSTVEGQCVPAPSYLHDRHSVRECAALQSLSCAPPSKQYFGSCVCGCEDPAP